MSEEVVKTRESYRDSSELGRFLDKLNSKEPITADTLAVMYDAGAAEARKSIKLGEARDGRYAPGHFLFDTVERSERTAKQLREEGTVGRDEVAGLVRCAVLYGREHWIKDTERREQFDTVVWETVKASCQMG